MFFSVMGFVGNLKYCKPCRTELLTGDYVQRREWPIPSLAWKQPRHSFKGKVGQFSAGPALKKRIRRRFSLIDMLLRKRVSTSARFYGAQVPTRPAVCDMLFNKKARIGFFNSGLRQAHRQPACTK